LELPIRFNGLDMGMSGIKGGAMSGARNKMLSTRHSVAGLSLTKNVTWPATIAAAGTPSR